MKNYTQKEIDVILEKHKKWLSGEGGERANLSSANLSSANLSSANLSSANLSSANLSYADLNSANLSYANLSYADLSYANLKVYQSQDYTAYIQKEFTRIGCQYHKNSKWLKFKDEEIYKMASDAKEYWDENGLIIKYLIKKAMGK